MNKFITCEPDDPHRCQASGKHGQCPYQAVQKTDGSFFSHCPRHNASRAREDENKRMKNYRLNKYQARMEEFAENESVKSLREEIGITRMVLEEIINHCNTSTDIIMASNKISDLVTKIEKLVSSCHRLEKSTGMLLDKASIQKLADTIIVLVSQHVDTDAANDIAIGIMKSITSAGPEDEQ